MSLDWLSSNCAIRSVSSQRRRCFAERSSLRRDDRGIIDEAACCSVSGDEDIVTIAVLLLVFENLQCFLLLLTSLIIRIWGLEVK